MSKNTDDLEMNLALLREIISDYVSREIKNGHSIDEQCKPGKHYNCSVCAHISDADRAVRSSRE